MLHRFRNWLVSGTAIRFDQLTIRLDEVNKELSALKGYVEHTQERMAKKLINSGSVQTGPDEVLAKVFSGLKIYLNPTDMAVAAHIAIDGVWENNISRAWTNVINADDTIFDIGANFGYFGLLAGQFTDKKNAKIVFFEANPAITPYINKSLSVNWLNEQSTVENLAVSDKSGTVELTLLDNYTGSSSIESLDHLSSYAENKMQISVKKTVKVKSVSIDSYCSNKKIGSVNLIKMDIEGHEETAYRGMKRIIQKSPSVSMFIEFTKASYKDPQRFYEEMLADFGNVYSITADGEIVTCRDKSYASVIGDSDDWAMPIFSKRKDLDRLNNSRIDRPL